MAYSENEHVIGKWIDGVTDVYEKTVEVNTSCSTAYGSRYTGSQILISGGVSGIVGIEGRISTASGNGFAVPYVDGTSDGKLDKCFSVYFGTPSVVLNLSTNYAITSVVGYVTVRFLKL